MQLQPEYLNFAYILVFIIGAMIGSFLNVMALRLLSEENFVKGRSKCPGCQTPIAWYDNIPILSYILLGAKCRNCKKHISIQYPIVELITGLLFLATFFFWGLSLKSLFLLFLICNLIVITVTDLKEKSIYDINSIPIIPLGLIYNFFDIGNNATETVTHFGINFNDVFISAVIGAVIGAAFFEIFSRVGLLLAGEYAFGEGDTLLGAALGAWFGWENILIILFISFILQVIIGVPIIISNMYKAKDFKSIAAMSGLLLVVILSFIGRAFTEAGEPEIALIVLLFSFILAGICIFIMLKRLRESQSYTFLPFGPPLVIAGLIVLYFSDAVAQYMPF